MRFVDPAVYGSVVVLMMVLGLLTGLAAGGSITLATIWVIHKWLSDPSQACPDNSCFGVDFGAAFLLLSGAGIGGLAGSVVGLIFGMSAAERCRRLIHRI